jgi:glycosyltransferase involved in cell wall biosynthesis
LKVLIVIGSLDPSVGGPARSSQGLCKYLSRLEIRAAILSFGKNDDLQSLQSVNQVYKINSKSYFRQKSELVEFLDFFGPDVIHCNGLWSPYIHMTIAVARKKNIPVLLSPRGTLLDWAVNYKRIKKRIAWLLYQRHDLSNAAGIHVTSEEEYRSIDNLNLNKPIYLVPNGIEIPDQLPVRLTIKETKRVLFLSRIHKQKGLIELLKAWAKLNLEKWILQISGTDKDNFTKDLTTLAGSLNILDSVFFTGPLNDFEKWKAYRESDIFVLPSFSENFGIVVAEALAAELPVITTKATPWGELISDFEKRAGWWIDIGVENLENALREATLLTDNERQIMGANGKKIIDNNYLWPKIAEKMYRIYTDIKRSHI